MTGVQTCALPISNTTEQGQFSDPVSTDWSVLVDTLDADLGTGKDHGIR